MADGTIFPSFVKVEHQANPSAKASFLAEVRGMTEAAEKQFQASFNEIGQVVERSVASISGKSINLDLGVSGLRQTAAEATLTEQKLIALRDTARELAIRTGDTSQATNKYLQALSAQTNEAQQARDIAEAQVRTYTRLQDALDRTIRKNDQLRDSYRATYLEQARSENFASRSQAAVNAGFAPAIGRQVKSARDSAAVFENAYSAPGIAPRADMRSGLDRLLGGDASLDRAAVSAATLDQVLGRVAQKGPQVAAALNAVSEAEQRAAKQAENLAQRIDRLAGELDPMVAVQQRFNSQMSLLDDALAAGAIGFERYSRLQQQLRTELQRTATVMSGTNGALRQASIQTGQQLQDIAISLYSGQQASIVFAQQLPQLAFGLSSLEGSANKTHDRIGRFATFLSGPWGVAVGLAVGVMGTLIASFISGEDAADDTGSAVSRLKDRLDLTKNSYESLIEVVNEYNKAQERTEAVTLRAAAAAEKEAKTLLAKAEAQLAALMANTPSFIDGDAAAAAAGREGAISQAESRIGRLQQGIRDAQRAVADITIKGQLDPVVAAQIAAGQRLEILEQEQKKGLITTQKYTAEKLKIERDLQTKIEQLRKEKRGDPANRQYGREIDSSQARSIAEKAGFQVNSQDRTYATQKRLYDQWVAAGKPKDNPVAFPGTSAHEKGNALDIQFGAGVSPASIKKAFQDEGVRLTKILKERGHYHIEWSTAGADKAIREAKQVEDYGERAAETIQRITEQFDAQPRAIDRAEQATRALKDVMDGLEARNILTPDAVQKIEAAKAAIADSFDRPVRDQERDASRNIAIQKTILEGRDAEADAMRRIWQYEDSMGPLTEERRQRIIAITVAEEQHIRALEQAQRIQGAYLEATRSVREEISAIFSGEGSFKNFGQIFKRLQGDVLTEKLFGSMFQDLDQWVKRNTGLGRATSQFTDSTSAAGKALDDLTKKIFEAADRLASIGSSSATGSAAANDNLPFPADKLEEMVDRALGPPLGPDGEIVVSGARDGGGVQRVEVTGRSVLTMTPEAYFDRLTSQLASRLTSSLDDALGTQFFGKFQGVVARGLYGYATGGVPGAVLGGAQGLAGMFGQSGLEKLLGKGVRGSGTGTTVAGISNALGIKMSGTGAQIGGAIGSLIPIPGGDILGAIAGGLIGKLFGGNKYGSAAVSNTGVGISGNNKDSKSGASSAGDAVAEGVQNLVDRLGAELGTYAVSIGVTNKKFNVNPGTVTGMIGTTKQRDTIDFGEDGEAAIEWAIRNAIEDGAVKGLSALENAILRKQTDIDKAVEQVLTVQDMRKRYKQWKDPIGAALDDLDEEFQKYRDLLTEFGGSTEDFNQALELYGHERAEIIKQQSAQLTASLKDLMKDLTIGDNGLSLRDRLGAAKAEYDPLAARVKAGDSTAFDDFAEAGRSVLDLTRQLYGSQSGYFDFLDELTSLTKNALDAQQAAIDTASAAASPFSATNSANDNAAQQAVVETQTQMLSDVLNAQLGAVNQNLGQILAQLRQGGGNGGSLLNDVGVAANF